MKNTALKRAGTILAFLLILMLLMHLLSPIFLPKDNTSEAGMYYEGAHGFMGEPEDSIDAFFIGDSETYSAISPMEMWNNRGLATYVCATGAQHLNVSYDYLQEIVKHQHPRVLFLETHVLFNKLSYSEAMLSEGARLFPMLTYHDRWKTLTASDFTQEPQYTHTESYRGFRNRFRVSEGPEEPYMTPTDKSASVSLLKRLYVARIVWFCRQNDIQLVLLSVPSSVNWDYEKHNAIQTLADQNQVPYLDLNLMTDEVPIDWGMDTRDQGDHLNYYGAVKVSAYLGDYLSEEYGLADHRGDERYASWDDALKRYQKEVARKS